MPEFDLTLASDLLSRLVTIGAAFLGLYLAWWRWGPGRKPAVFIRNVVLVPPGSQAKLTLQNVVPVVDMILVNRSPVAEILTDITLKIISPTGSEHFYDPKVYADPRFFFEDVPEWVEHFFHPLVLPTHGEDKSANCVEKCMLFFPYRESPPLPKVSGTYRFILTTQKDTPISWRRTDTWERSFELSEEEIRAVHEQGKKVAFLHSDCQK